MARTPTRRGARGVSVKTRQSKRGLSVAAKEALVRTPKNSRFKLGATRTPAPANAGNVGLGGKTGVTTPRERKR